MKNLYLVCTLLLCIFLSACASTSLPTFYLLPNFNPIEVTEKANEKTIGILPISLPSYLLRPQIVTKNVATSQVEISEFHRWGENLDDAFQRVLSTSLSSKLLDKNYTAIPLRMGYPVDCRLLIDVISFEGSLDSDVALNAYWLLRNDSKILSQGSFYKSIPAGATYNELVISQAKLIDALADDIVTNIK